MAITWERLHRDFSMARALQGLKDTGRHAELWKVRGIPASSGAYGDNITPHDVATLLDGAGASGLVPPPMYPANGSAHPDLPNCVVIDKEIVKGPNLGCATIRVVYGPTPFLSYRGGPRLWGAPEHGQTSLRVPIINAPTGAPPWCHREDDMVVSRGNARRVRPKLISWAANLDLLADLIEPNVGRLYTLTYSGGGVASMPFLLDGYRFTEAGVGNGELVLTYFFSSPGPVGPMPANTFSGQGIALPALDYLQVYSVDTTVFPPVIRSVMPAYLPGAPLP